MRWQEPVLFDIEKFQKALNTRWLGSEFLFVEQADSTNTVLKKKPAGQISHGTVLLADLQHKGRGQYDRVWESEPGKNLTFTIAFKPSGAERLPLLTLAIATAINQSLQAVSDISFQVKWPNDLMCNGGKIGGLLTESIFNGQQIDRVLIGIGLNVCQTSFSKEISSGATSLKLITDKIYERETLLADILQRIEKAYDKWNIYDDSLLHEVNRNLIGYGKWVTISIDGKTKKDKVKFLGINERGQLVILTHNYDVETFSYEQIRVDPDD